MSAAAGLSAEELRAALEAATHTAEQIRVQIADLKTKLDAIERERSLLEQLLHLRDGVTPVQTPAASAQRHSASRPSDESLQDAVVRLIETRGEVMHIGDLMEQLVSEGVPIPGKGTQDNVISRIANDHRIARPGRGRYGLKALGHEDNETLTDQCEQFLRDKIRRAASLSADPWLEVRAGDLQQELGELKNDPQWKQRPAVVSAAMRKVHEEAYDRIVESPPKGKGPSLRIKYSLTDRRSTAPRPDARS